MVCRNTRGFNQTWLPSHKRFKRTSNNLHTFARHSSSHSNRWQTIQRVAYTLGGFNNRSLLNSVKQASESNGSFTGEEKKYLQCAEICFNAGTQNLHLNGLKSSVLNLANLRVEWLKSLKLYNSVGMKIKTMLFILYL